MMPRHARAPWASAGISRPSGNVRSTTYRGISPRLRRRPRARIGDPARFARTACPCFDLPVSRSVFVAALQSAGVPGDPAATLTRFERDVRTLRSTFDGLELVVAPELHLMALLPLLGESGPSERELAVDVPGELTERLGALARETGLWLIPGSVYERTADGIANTAV